MIVRLTKCNDGEFDIVVDKVSILGKVKHYEFKVNIFEKLLGFTSYEEYYFTVLIDGVEFTFEYNSYSEAVLEHALIILELHNKEKHND